MFQMRVLLLAGLLLLAAAQDCGPGLAPCADGYCCSKFGFCGNTDAFCSPLNGCIENCWGTCGDGACRLEEGETCTNCLADCGACNPQQCGNGLCEKSWLPTGETCGNCPTDCGPCQAAGGVITACVDPGHIALTFDNAPSQQTNTILDVLLQYNISGTFFLTGDSALQFPPVVQQALADGHTLGSFSSSGVDLTSLYMQAVWTSIITAEAQLAAAGTCVIPRVFRPPAGKIDDIRLSLLSSMGYTVLGWNLGPDGSYATDPSVTIGLLKPAPLISQDASAPASLNTIISSGFANQYTFVTAEQCVNGASFSTSAMYAWTRAPCVSTSPGHVVSWPAAPTADVPCPTSDWSPWSPCDAGCGTGTQTRVRYAYPPSAAYTSACANTSFIQSQDCNTATCILTIPFSPWSDWSDCSVLYGGGTQIRTRDPQLEYIGPVTDFGAVLQTRLCNLDACPDGQDPHPRVDCVVTDWTAFGSCSRTCGGGIVNRTRLVSVSPLNGGTACPSLIDVEPCNTQTCVTDCVLSDWSSYGACSVECGGGTYTRSRSVVTAPAGGGAACDTLTDSATCNTAPCPVPCVTSPWSSWGPCSLPCGNGTSTRTRTIITPDSCGGTPCGPLVDWQYCNTQFCGVSVSSSPIPASGSSSLTTTATPTTSPAQTSAALSSSSSYSSSSSSHSSASSSSSTSSTSSSSSSASSSSTSFSSSSSSSYSPIASPYATASSSPSVGHSPVCTLSDWSPWSTCSVACGGGEQAMTRSVIAGCCDGATTPLAFVQACNTQACSADCQVSDWSPFSSCSPVCGNGNATRFRHVLTAAVGSGAACPALSESQTCNLLDCVCTYGAWGPWITNATAQTRTRPITTTMLPPGITGTIAFVCANGTVQTIPLAPAYTPIDCALSDWSPWGDCSTQCGVGVYNRTRTVVTPEFFGGAPCGPTLDLEVCSVTTNCQECVTSPSPAPFTISPSPIPSSGPCVLSPWSAWSACGAACGGGEQSRYRTIISGCCDASSPLTQLQPCNTAACNVDCLVSDWSAYSPCSIACGNGSSVRTRVVVSAQSGNGQACPAGGLVDIQPCQLQPCVCTYGPWSPWSPCVECGSIYQTRTRAILTTTVPPGYGTITLSALCGNGTIEAEPALTGPPPVDCVLSDWSDYGDCSEPCGTGMQNRTRTIVTLPLNGGAVCGNTEDIALCNTGPCVGCGVSATPTPSPPSGVCVLSAWSPWSACAAACGGGTRTRYRDIVSGCCGDSDVLTQLEACNTVPCDEDCVISDWSDWSPCSVACGDGTQTSTRVVVMPASGSGAACPAGGLVRTQTCSQRPCVCSYGDWGSWSPCEECGEAYQIRTRPVETTVLPGGVSGTLYAVCGNGTQENSLDVSAWTSGCTYTEWSVFGSCSESCGTGVYNRTRQLVRGGDGSVPCGPFEDVQLCNTGACCGASPSASPSPFPGCVVSAWGPPGVCSAPCGGYSGFAVQSRTVISRVTPSSPCPPLVQSVPCISSPCNSPCVVSPWSEWSQCTADCDGGVTSRNRSYVSGDATSCPPLVDSRLCNTQPCDVDCLESDWSQWDNCTSHCIGGITHRHRSIYRYQENNGRPCGVLDEQMPCADTVQCACTFSPWSHWSACNATCGDDGYSTRDRSLLIGPSCPSLSCGEVTQTTPCNHRPCPQDCLVSEWSAWSVCPFCSSSLPKISSSARTVLRPAANGGTACGPLYREQPCTPVPVPVDCVVSSWSPWSACSPRAYNADGSADGCAGGSQERTRGIITPASDGGKACGDLEQCRDCTLTSDCGDYTLTQCPSSCQLSDWSAFGACSAVCGGGTQTRTRTVAAGSVCVNATLTDSAVCGTTPCPVDCTVSDWAAWSPCTASCGGGNSTHTRTIITPPQHGGAACPPLSATQPCNTQCCGGSVNCQTSPWSDWSTCSARCGGGVQQRQRSVTVPAQGNGTSCGSLIMQQACNTDACTASGCVYGNWTQWSPCSVFCGGGVSTRSQPLITAGNNGTSCPPVTQSEPCNTDACPSSKDCVLGDWTTPCVCTAQCGGGIAVSTRAVLVQPQGGGAACGAITQQSNCNTATCPAGTTPTDCFLGDWTAWGTCTATCGGGVQVRSRPVLRPSAGSGMKCGPVVATQACGTSVCLGGGSNDTTPVFVQVAPPLLPSATTTVFLTVPGSVGTPSVTYSWTQQLSYTNPSLSPLVPDTTLVSAVISSPFTLTTAVTFTQPGVYVFLFTAATSRARVVVWVPGVTLLPGPSSGVCYSNRPCTLLHAWSFLPVNTAKVASPMLLPIPAPLSAFEVFVVLQASNVLTPHIQDVTGATVTTVSLTQYPQYPGTGTFTYATVWDVPFDAFPSNTYSVRLLFSLSSQSAGGVSVLSTGVAEGAQFAIRNPVTRLYGPWSGCSATCGVGEEVRNVSCFDLLASSYVNVSTTECAQQSVTSPIRQPCTLTACAQYTWRVTSSWTACSDCVSRTQSRTVACTDASGNTVASTFCTDPQPDTVRACVPDDTACGVYAWSYTPWSACDVPWAPSLAGAVNGSKTLCPGLAHRHPICKSAFGYIVSPIMCPPVNTSSLCQPCNIPVNTLAPVGGVQQPSCSLPVVTYTPWSPCSAPCGGGVSTRTATCTLNGSPVSCTSSAPVTSRTCNSAPCVRYHWATEVFGECLSVTNILQHSSGWSPAVYGGFSAQQLQQLALTVTCGGLSFRGVSCVNAVGVTVADSLCGSIGNKPLTYTPCGTCNLCLPNWATVDQLAAFPLCSGHGNCFNGGCNCTAGWTGPVCNATASCPSGLVSFTGQCCVGPMDVTGACCPAGNVLDSTGRCCASGSLTPCGTCASGPSTALLDSRGTCCVGTLDAGGVCCPAPLTVDACGVCDGVGACTFAFTLTLLNLDGLTTAQLQSASNPITVAYSANLTANVAMLLGVDDSRVGIGALAAASCPGPSIGLQAEFIVSPSHAIINGVDVWGGETVVSYGDLLVQLKASAWFGPRFVSLSIIGSEGDCGNGVCEVNERCGLQANTACCPQDCPLPFTECPLGPNGLPCGGNGVCLSSTATTGVCSCYVAAGWVGPSCSQCAPGFTAIGTQCVRSFPTSAFENFGAGTTTTSSSSPSIFTGALGGIIIGAIVFVCIGAVVTTVRYINRRRGLDRTSSVRSIAQILPAPRQSSDTDTPAGSLDPQMFVATVHASHSRAQTQVSPQNAIGTVVLPAIQPGRKLTAGTLIKPKSAFVEEYPAEDVEATQLPDGVTFLSSRGMGLERVEESAPKSALKSGQRLLSGNLDDNDIETVTPRNVPLTTKPRKSLQPQASSRSKRSLVSSHALEGVNVSGDDVAEAELLMESMFRVTSGEEGPIAIAPRPARQGDEPAVMGVTSPRKAPPSRGGVVEADVDALESVSVAASHTALPPLGSSLPPLGGVKPPRSGAGAAMPAFDAPRVPTPPDAAAPLLPTPPAPSTRLPTPPEHKTALPPLSASSTKSRLFKPTNDADELLGIKGDEVLEEADQ